MPTIEINMSDEMERQLLAVAQEAGKSKDEMAARYSETASKNSMARRSSIRRKRSSA